MYFLLVHTLDRAVTESSTSTSTCDTPITNRQDSEARSNAQALLLVSPMSLCYVIM
jgi:hypothetical protein